MWRWIITGRFTAVKLCDVFKWFLHKYSSNVSDYFFWQQNIDVTIISPNLLTTLIFVQHCLTDYICIIIPLWTNFISFQWFPLSYIYYIVQHQLQPTVKYHTYWLHAHMCNHVITNGGIPVVISSQYTTIISNIVSINITSSIIY